MNARALLLAGLLLAILFFTGYIEPCDDGHKCPPVATAE